MTTDRDARKREAAMVAVAMVEDGMVVGLGTGSTAAFAIEGLIARVRQGLRIVGIPTSERSARQAAEGGLQLTDFAHHTKLDLTIDGADEIARDSLNLVKGLGGALLREKIVAAASERLVIIADEPKLVSGLGGTAPVPIEVVDFGWQTTAVRLRRLGANPVLRTQADGTPPVWSGPWATRSVSSKRACSLVWRPPPWSRPRGASSGWIARLRSSGGQRA